MILGTRWLLHQVQDDPGTRIQAVWSMILGTRAAARHHDPWSMVLHVYQFFAYMVILYIKIGIHAPFYLEYGPWSRKPGVFTPTGYLRQQNGPYSCTPHPLYM